MARRVLADGTEVEYPDGVLLSEGEGDLGGLGAAAPQDAGAEPDPLLEAVRDFGEFQLAKPFSLEGRPEGGLEGGLGALAGDAVPEVVVRVPLAEDQAAVQLTESDGVYRWEYPLRIEAAPGGLGAEAGGGAAKVAVFSSPYRPVAVAQEEGLGFTGEFLLKPVKKLIVRFLARKTAQTVAGYLERNIDEQPFLYSQPPNGEAGWAPTPSFAAAWSGGAEKPRRLLLFVHGTFSSVLGSFGGLSTTEPGQDFLARALEDYDAIAGFDHKTLTKSVGENAKDLLALLDTLPPGEVEVDAIAFSRGGLVLRYLTEVLLPESKKSRFHLRKAIFVGCTNGGTILADSEHWKDLVDLYTNLVAAAGRVASALGGPQTKLASKIVAEALKGALSFVRYLAEATTDGGAVPGLASMSPKGQDVEKINERQDGQPMPGKVSYYVIDANFDHVLFGEGKTPGNGLPKRLFLELTDNFIEQLFKDVENDLVVDRPSMSRIDPWTTEKWIVDRMGFESDAGVYHTIYFYEAGLAAKLAGWLRPEPAG